MAHRGVARCVFGLLVILRCLSGSGAAQPTEVDALSIFVVLKCLPVSNRKSPLVSSPDSKFLHHRNVVGLQATFLSFGLNGIPLDQETSGVASTGPANGAMIAKLSPAVSSITKAILAEDVAQIRSVPFRVSGQA